MLLIRELTGRLNRERRHALPTELTLFRTDVSELHFLTPQTQRFLRFTAHADTHSAACTQFC